jgi:hypothetical protein
MEKETEYADLKWSEECEVGDVETRIIGGRKWDIISINDLDDQLLRESCKSENAIGIVDYDNDKYQEKLLLKVIVKPKLTRELINNIRKNKKSGLYAKLIHEVMDISGVKKTRTVRRNLHPHPNK